MPVAEKYFIDYTFDAAEQLYLYRGKPACADCWYTFSNTTMRCPCLGCGLYVHANSSLWRDGCRCANGYCGDCRVCMD